MKFNEKNLTVQVTDVCIGITYCFHNFYLSLAHEFFSRLRSWLRTVSVYHYIIRLQFDVPVLRRFVKSYSTL